MTRLHRGKCLSSILAVFLIVLLAPTSSASDQIDPQGIPGTLILAGGRSLPDEAATSLTESTKGQPLLLLHDASSAPDDKPGSPLSWLSRHGISAVTRPQSASSSEHQAQTVTAIGEANAVWIEAGDYAQLTTNVAQADIRAAVLALLQRGGTVVGTSTGAARMSQLMVSPEDGQQASAPGWNLLPHSIVIRNLLGHDRSAFIQSEVNRHPECFGLSIDENIAVIIRGRRMQIVGEGGVSLVLAGTADRESQMTRLMASEIADLPQLQRAAAQRGSGINPGEPTNGPPEVTHGSLVIVGGGSMPQPVVDRFIELAGGSEARIVILPTAVPREESTAEVPGFLKRADLKSVTVLTQRGSEVETEEFRSVLAAATGVWFGGGRQWNFVDAYEGTSAIELFHDVLRRGGVIGGSSAGATIQGEFLVRGHPLGNTIMMAEGYERGFSFLPGVAIDQHFAQRNRFPDLLPVIQRHPHMLGIGLDEGTAIVVQGSHVDVIGEKSAHFLSSRQLQSSLNDQPLPTDSEDAAKLYVTVPAGKSFDLKALQQE